MNGYHLTKFGNVVLADNTTWMANPSGKVARFRNFGDQLHIPIPGDPVLPDASSVLKIEFRVYPRAYKTPTADSLCVARVADIFTLRQAGDAQWRVIYPEGRIAPHVEGPYSDDDPDPNRGIILSAAVWAEQVTLNTWHAVKITVASDGASRVYIDDMNTAKGVMTFAPLYARSSDWCVVIGNFDGDIDELRISKTLP